MMHGSFILKWNFDAIECGRIGLDIHGCLPTTADFICMLIEN